MYSFQLGPSLFPWRTGQLRFILDGGGQPQPVLVCAGGADSHFGTCKHSPPLLPATDKGNTGTEPPHTAQARLHAATRAVIAASSCVEVAVTSLRRNPAVLCEGTSPNAELHTLRPHIRKREETSTGNPPLSSRHKRGQSRSNPYAQIDAPSVNRMPQMKETAHIPSCEIHPLTPRQMQSHHSVSPT